MKVAPITQDDPQTNPLRKATTTMIHDAPEPPHLPQYSRWAVEVYECRACKHVENCAPESDDTPLACAGCGAVDNFRVYGDVINPREAEYEVWAS